MKQNDWLVAGLLNPEFNTSDFLISGLTPDNTQLLTAEQYKKSSFVRDRFTEDGVFNEQKFDDFYKKRAEEFGKLQSMDVKDTFVYSPFDTKAKPNSSVQSPNYSLDIVANPNREVNVFGATHDGGFSQRELAQQSRIWDTEKGEWSTDTVNDRALFSNPGKWLSTVFGDPLVYATYDSDGEHYDTFTGQMMPHKKGEYKLNKYGLPYTETLDGRSLVNKEVVSGFDLLTVDGKGANKYDFFDSDGLDKSVTGTVMKSAAAIAPMFMGPYVASIYSGLLVGRELMKTLPMLYGLTTAWFDMPAENGTLNKLAGIGQALTTGTSDAGKSSMLNLEVLSNMVTDVALQWGQQKAIATSIGKLRGGKELVNDAYKKAGTEYAASRAALEQQASRGTITREALERYVGDASKWQESAIGRAAIQKYMKDVQPIVDRTRRLGADASLVYMALVSNTDVYQSMLEAGASRKEAAAVALGSTIGMFSVDRFLGLGELFFDDLTADYERQLRRTLTKEAKSWYDKTIKQTIQEPSKSKLDKFRGLFQKGVDWGKKKTNKFVDDLKYHSTGFTGKAVGEGLEEVGEEFVSDISKGLYELASDLGFNTTVSDVGAFDNWKERYAMSFLGGTLGGGLFYGVNIYQNGKFHVDQTQDELIYLVRNGKTQDVLKTLDKWRDQGKFGSTSLSINTTKDSEGNDIFLTAENSSDSQNEFIYNRIKETVLQLQNIIDNNDANLNDDELYDKMILSEARFQGLQKYLQGQSYTTNYQQDYQNALNNVVNLESALTRARKTRTGLPYQSDEEYSRNIATDEQLRNMTEHEKQARDRNIKKVEEDLKSAKEELDRFLSGEYSMEYTEKMLFALDENLNKEFVTMTYDQWLKRAHDGKTPGELSPDEAIQYKEEYLTYKANKQKEDLTKQFGLYKAIKAQMDPILLGLSQNQDKFLKFNQEFQVLQESDIFNVAPYTFDSVLDIYGETEESDSYRNRNNPEGRLARQEQVKQANMEYANQLRKEILKVIDKAGGFIDPLARRKLKLLLQTRNKDLLKNLQEELKNQMILSNSTIDTNTGQVLQRGTLSELDRSVLQLLGSIDLAHLDKVNNVWDQIKSLVESSFIAPIRQRNELYGNIRSYIRDARIGDNYDPEEPELTGRALYDMIQYQIDQGRTIDEVFDLNNTELYPDNTETYEGLTRAQLAAFLNDVRARYEAQTRSDNPIAGALTDTNEYLTRSLQQSLDDDENVQRELSYYNGIFQGYLRSVKENPLINLNKELDARVSSINPVIELVKNLGLHLNTNMDNLEKILTNLDQKYDQVEDVHDLILSPEEKESFEEATQIIRLAQSYLYAASNTPNILRPFGHNATLNEFAENHKDIYKDFQPLPVISQELFNAFDYQLSNYLLQMGVQDPKSKEYNVGSWLYLSNHNEVDKAGQFIRAEKAWNKACYDVFMNHPESFKFEYNGTSYNLLDGAESVPEVGTDTPDAIVYLNQLFNIFHKNIDELVKQGWTYKQIWERSGVLDKLLKINTVPQQKTVSLDQNVTEGNMTYYDKAILLATVAAMDSTKFYSYLRGRVEEENGIVPLTIQEWVSRVGIAELENPEIFNQTLEYVKQKTGDPKPILYNTVYIPGNAGAGKSRVVARNIVKYLKSNNIWLSAPKESQIITLFESTSKGVKMLNRKNSESESSEFPILMEQLGIDQKVYKEALDVMSDENILSKIEKGEFPQSPNFMIKETNEAYVVEINPDKFGIKKIQNAPEVIVIDEATHLSNLELQILSQFARVNNSKLILLGDSKQKGWNGLGKNIDREQCFTVRAPNLGISLRDDNVQHQFNLRTLEDLINQLSNLDEEDPGYKQQVATIKALLHNIQLKVYNQDEINGEQILTSLTQPYVNKLHGTVGYVGRQPSATLDLLKNSNLEVTVLPEVDIQGQEFDYVVIDKDFSIPNKETSDFRLLDFLRDLYTMISRGRKGSIIIDPTGKLQIAIGSNRVEFVKAQAPRIIEYADQFRRQKLDVLDKVLGTEQRSGEQQGQGGTEQGTNQGGAQEDQTTPEIILDKDFSVNDLDFNNNYYVIWQIPFAQAGNIQQVGITDAKGLEGNVIFATRDLINQVITTQKEGRGYNGADAIVLMQFSKDTFGTGISDITTITSKVEELDNTDNNIPTKYIKNIIHTTPLDTKDDIKTDPSDTLQPPTPTEADIKEQATDEDDLPSAAEDVDSDTPSNPILCFGQATFTGMRVEKREKKQVWINPSQHEYSDMLSIQSPEIKAILQQARRNAQGKLLAPNGKISNLSQQQWAYVRTKEFKSWFGDWENDPQHSSKMLDENGEPKVFYHGNPTGTKITKFDLNRIGTSHQERAIKGFWFTPNKEYAEYEYASNPIEGTKGEVVPVFLNIRNIYNDTQEGIRKETVQDDQKNVIGETWKANESIDDVINRASQQSLEGTDGYSLTFINTDGGSDTIDYTSPQQSIIALRPDQIKIARDFQDVSNSVKRDIQIFTDKEEIADTQEQIDLSRKIRALKNAILYRRDYNSLPDYITKLISKDQFDNIKWHIEVRRPNDQDNFIRNIRFKESEIGISSRNLMFAVVGEVELNDGTRASVTLGLLSNPKNWINQIGKEGGIRDRIKRKIEKLESRLNGKVVLTQRQKDNIQKKIDKYRTQLDNLDINNPQSEPIQYSNYIEKLASMYDGEHPVVVPITGLIRPGLTDLHRQQKPVRLARISKALIRSAENRLKLLNQNLAKVKGASIIRARIEEEIEQTKKKLEEFKQIQDVSFRSLNPYTVVSPMYIYTPSSAIRGTADIDDSVVGKCNVVFVTNEEGADPNTLVDKYIAQKKAIEAERQANGIVDLRNSNVVPTVRMIVLNNLGVSFQDMSNPYLAESMTGEVSYENEGGERVARKQIYPFRTNYMGVRMYVGLWNFRANLLNFKEKFDTFVESLPIDRSLLDDYLRVKDLQWRRDNGRTLSDTEIDYLSKYQNLDKFDEVSKLVDDFNDSLSNQVKEFRLGSDLANGAYIRYLTGDVSALYNTNEKVSGIYINSATFENYLNLAESLFTNVLDQIITCEYPKDRLLSAKEGVRNSFSGYTKTLANTNGVLEIKDYDEEGKVVTKDTIRFGSAYGATGVMNSFSHIPAVLSKVFKYTSLRQTHLSGRNFDTQDRYSIRVQGTIEQDGKEVKIDKVLPYWNIWQYVSMANGQDEYDLHALDNYTWDNNFSNFFSFAFHGTLEDVQDSNAQRATDAFAPKGFFADPLSTTDRVYDGKNKMFTKAVQQQVFFGSDVTVGDPTFFITLGTLKQAVDNAEKQPVVLDTDITIQQCNDIVTDVSAKYPQLAESFREVLNGIDTIESSQRVEIVQNLIGDIIESEVTSNYNSLFDKAYNVATITPNMLVKKVSNTEAATLQEVLKQQYMEKYNEDLPDITGFNRDGNKLVIDAGDISLYVSRQLDGSMSISKIGGPVVQESIVVSEINNLLSALDKVLKQSDKDHLQKNIADYQAVSDDLKQQQKQTIIKTLKRLSSTYMGKREAFKLIKNTINKISEPNCI